MRDHKRNKKFEQAYLQHRQSVLRWCLRYGAGSKVWAEDVTQEVFVKLHQHFDRLDVQRELGGWLFRATANAAISRWRKERSLLGRIERALGQAAAPSAEQLFEAREDAQGVWRAIAELNGPVRVALSMKVLDGKSQQEIAEIMGWSKGQVSKLVARGWQQLKAQGWEVPDDEA